MDRMAISYVEVTAGGHAATRGLDPLLEPSLSPPRRLFPHSAWILRSALGCGLLTGGILLASATPARADEPPPSPAIWVELKTWIEGLETPPARDSEALVRFRKRIHDLEDLVASLAVERTPLQPRYLGVWAALATDPNQNPPGPEAPQAPYRKRVALRAALIASLDAGTLGPSQARALDATKGELLRELAGDPLAGPWRSAALHALGGRPSGLETLRRVARAGGPALRPALASLVSQKDTKGLGPVLLAALERDEVQAARDVLSGLKALRGTPPLERVRGILRREGPIGPRATLARALGALGWSEGQGALRRFLREPALRGSARVGVTAAYLRLGGSPDPLGAEVAALTAAALEPGPFRQEAFLALASLPPARASQAIQAELRRPDPSGTRRARAIHAAEALALSQLTPAIRLVLADSTQPHLARAAAAHALGAFATSEDQAALVLLARDRSPALRRAALAALVKIPRTRRVVAVRRSLIEGLSDAEPALRRVALAALQDPSDLPLLRAALAEARPSLVTPLEVQAWLQRARALALVDAEPAAWLLSRWQSRPELKTSKPLALATLRYARTLEPGLAAPVLLDLLEHASAEVKHAAQAALTQRYPSGRDFAGAPARWRRAWREHTALFR